MKTSPPLSALILLFRSGESGIRENVIALVVQHVSDKWSYTYSMNLRLINMRDIGMRDTFAIDP